MGYLLLFLGLGIMVFCVINVFMVFTNRVKPISAFNISSDSSESTFNVNDIISKMQKNNPNVADELTRMPKLDLIPPEALNQALNLSSHFFLMSFLLGFGYKIANLGVQMIRVIKVKLKSTVLEVEDSDKTQESPQASIETISSSTLVSP